MTCNFFVFGGYLEALSNGLVDSWISTILEAKPPGHFCSAGEAMQAAADAAASGMVSVVGEGDIVGLKNLSVCLEVGYHNILKERWSWSFTIIREHD